MQIQSACALVCAVRVRVLRALMCEVIVIADLMHLLRKMKGNVALVSQWLM